MDITSSCDHNGVGQSAVAADIGDPHDALASFGGTGSLQILEVTKVLKTHPFSAAYWAFQR